MSVASRMAIIVLALLASAAAAEAADWRQFRGNNADGVAAEEDAPGRLGTTVWEAALPGEGKSGPIVVNDRVIVTASSGHRQARLHVACFSDADGSQLWERQFWATGRTSCHDKMSVATSNPASDGERIFALYSSNDLACLDLDGNLVWYRGLTYDFPNASNTLGMASSPVVVGKTVIVQVESDAEAFTTGIDVETGVSRWRIERPRTSNWASPALLPRGDEEPLVLLASGNGVAAIEAETGEQVAFFDGGASTIPSPVCAGGLLLVPSGGITALRANEAGDGFDEVWKQSRLSPSTPSPIAYAGNVYAVNGAGVLVCGDAETGKVEWQHRLGGDYSATPVAAGGHVYVINEEGTVIAVDVTGERGETVAEKPLGELILGTPAIANGALYARGDTTLWKLTE